MAVDQNRRSRRRRALDQLAIGYFAPGHRLVALIVGVGLIVLGIGYLREQSFRHAVREEQAHSFALERKVSNARRSVDFAESVRAAVKTSCDKQNQTLTALRGIVVAGEAQVRKLEQEGTITDAQLERSLASSRAALGKLMPLPCADIAAHVQFKAKS